jgi:hypothetical protein
LRRLLASHTVKTTAEMGWQNLKNGKLLAAAADHFDVLLTVDRNLRYQQNPVALPLAVLVLVAKSNKLAALAPLIPATEQTLAAMTPRTIVEVR